jgi:urease accessory protein
MASGDELRIDCAVESGAHCLLTGPAAGKVYGMDASGTAQRQHFSAKVDNGVLEWLPQETILFDGSGAVFSSRFNLGGQSRLIAWDIVCFGRPAAGEAFERGRFSQRTEIWRDGEPLVHEGLDMEAGGRLWESPAGLGGCAVAATVYACGCGDDAGALREARARLWERFPAPAENRAAHGAGGRSGVTLRGGVLMARHMGHDSAAAKGFCRSVWHVVRPLLLGRPPVPPRVWST